MIRNQERLRAHADDGGLTPRRRLLGVFAALVLAAGLEAETHGDVVARLRAFAR